MALSGGVRVGTYEIVALIGAGGMGEVYEARDTRLDRAVALKVLPATFLNDLDRLGRFDREARVLASLDHPNIAPIFGFVEADGVSALALALVTGPTLSERIKAGPVPIAEAVNLAQQIVAALEYAHEHNVIHRDLKPANIKITPEGQVKVLDFGLAKVLDEEKAATAEADASTLTWGNTRAGQVLGTPAYMAPEQVTGKPADRRGDIFSFGAVLFEMLAGVRAFGGDSAEETMASVLRSEPDWSKLPNGTPRAVRILIGRCLNKDPKLRLQAIGEARILLSSQEATEFPAGSSARSFHLWLAIIAIGLTVALGALSVVHFREDKPEQRAITSFIVPPENSRFVLDLTSVSPDGRRAVLTDLAAKGPQLWMLSFETSKIEPIPGTENGRRPFWSPDSRYIAFVANRKLQRLDPSAGLPVILAEDAANVYHGSWSHDGAIVYQSTEKPELRLVPASGGPSVTLPTRSESVSGGATAPSFLPDGKHFVFLDLRDQGGADGTLRLATLDSAQTKALGPANSSAVFANGHLVYLRGNALVAQPFDLGRLEFTGEALPLNKALAQRFSVSAHGLLLYQSASGLDQMTWFNRDHNSERNRRTLGDPARFFTLEFSPDRKRLAVSVDEDVWLIDIHHGIRTRFTQTPGIDTNAIWSPDGRYIAFSSQRSGHYGVYRRAADLSGSDELIFTNDVDTLTDSWSPNGKSLLVHVRHPKTGNKLYILPLELPAGGGARQLISFLATPFNELHARYSPDGQWVAYQSSASGRFEVYISPISGSGARIQVSDGGGLEARWRADGKELFYQAQSGELMATEISTRDGILELGETKPLGFFTRAGWLYDVATDGQSFLAAVPPSANAALPLTLVYNWPLLLKK